MALRKLLSLLFCAAALLAGAGCSDSEGDISYDPADLIGTWQKIKLFDDQWIEENTRVIFREDGTGEDAWTDDYQTGSDPFTYILKGNVLTIDFEGDITTQYIAKLTRTELVVTNKDRSKKAYFRKLQP